MENEANRYENLDELELVIDLISQINSNLDLDSVLRNIISAVKVVTSSEACSVFLIDKASDELILSVPSGPAEKKITGIKIPRSEGIAGWVSVQSQPVIVNDVSADSRFRGDFDPETFVTRNMICTPLLNQSGDVIGVLQAMNKTTGGSFQSGELPLFRALGNQAAIAITNARLHEEKETLLAEIHHRVKNNMAVVSSMIQLQAMAEKDHEIRGKLLNNVSRISSMAAVHEQLYRSQSFSNIDFAENLRNIVTNTLKILKTECQVSSSFDLCNLQLNINLSIPSSLVVNEIVGHVIKYGFEDRSEGQMTVELAFDPEQELVTLSVSDDGSSVLPQLEGAFDGVSGFQLIEVLSKQIKAKYRYEPGPDMNRFVLEFKKTNQRGAGNYSM